HPRITALLERSGSLHVDEFALARGVALGLFVGFTPTVGIQTLMMVAGSLAFRANFPAAFIVSFVSNPVTMAPLYFGFNRLGHLLMDWLPIQAATPATLGDEIAEQTLAMLLGSLAIAIPAGVLGYFATLWLFRALGFHLPIRKGLRGAAAEARTAAPDDESRDED
ncbi:MAG: DUF2062 domain-containing protein, partial [Wenzhouxiangellaceae bacterium]|nr:DUF2062 domain-containing protein [Wenzhouxiangellaceae bacterium]